MDDSNARNLMQLLHSNEEAGVTDSLTLITELASSPAMIDRKVSAYPSFIGYSSDFPIEHKDTFGCNCRKSKCLKLYCACFAKHAFCNGGCRCIGCYNTSDTVDERDNAIRAILERNPSAFSSKVISSAPTAHKRSHAEIASTSDEGISVHRTGCRCRKSQCKKVRLHLFQSLSKICLRTHHSLSLLHIFSYILIEIL
jgi:hypothetical protein